MELLVSILYYFRQGAKIIGKGNIQNTLAGNLDPFYMAAPLYFYSNYRDKNKMKKIFIVVLSIYSWGFIQLIFNEDINITKMIINITKIIICITCMLYVKENCKKINILKITKITSVLFAISIPISYLFYKSSVLWRHNDIHNKYSLSRLNLFYLEPSELGFHVAILIIILIGYLFICKNKKERLVLLFLIATNSIVLYMARPLGAIVIATFTIGIMILLDLIYKPNKLKFKLYGVILAVALLIVVILIMIKSPIYMRIIDTLRGTDSSNSYRIGVTLNVFKESFFDYNGIGCGFGNLNTSNFISNYSDLGLVVVVTNSFFYFIIETGIAGIIVGFLSIMYLFRICIKEKSVIKLGLFIFLMLYQIFGGHFTSGLYWIIYGIILSKYNENYEIG